MKDIKACLAAEEDLILAKTIAEKMEAVALIKGCGMSELSAASVIEKIKAGRAVIAVTENNILLGLFYNAVGENGEINNSCRVYRIAKPGK